VEEWSFFYQQYIVEWKEEQRTVDRQMITLPLNNVLLIEKLSLLPLNNVLLI
jgi:hypothetical protein